MLPSYERFMRPILRALPDDGALSHAELAAASGRALDLPASVAAERVAWDGMPALEARVRKSVIDLEMAGLVVRRDDGVAITPDGRAARDAIPEAPSLEQLESQFPAYAAYREQFRQRRGA
jgi:ribosomal protein S19E (S16A)